MLKKKEALKAGVNTIQELDEEHKTEEGNDEITIDTSKQEKEMSSSGREYIATGSRDKKIRIFDVKSGRQVLMLAGHDNWITDLKF